MAQSRKKKANKQAILREQAKKDGRKRDFWNAMLAKMGIRDFQPAFPWPDFCYLILKGYA